LILHDRGSEVIGSKRAAYREIVEQEEGFEPGRADLWAKARRRERFIPLFSSEAPHTVSTWPTTNQ
jgi:hypothetical protein